jgi:hypothetical protein
VIVWQRYLDVTLSPPEGESPIIHALQVAHLPALVLVPAAGLLVLGLAAQVWALWSLSARRALPVPLPMRPEALLPRAGVATAPAALAGVVPPD